MNSFNYFYFCFIFFVLLIFLFLFYFSRGRGQRNVFIFVLMENFHRLIVHAKSVLLELNVVRLHKKIKNERNNRTPIVALSSAWKYEKKPIKKKKTTQVDSEDLENSSSSWASPKKPKSLHQMHNWRQWSFWNTFQSQLYCTPEILTFFLGSLFFLILELNGAFHRKTFPTRMKMWIEVDEKNKIPYSKFSRWAPNVKTFSFASCSFIRLHINTQDRLLSMCCGSWQQLRCASRHTNKFLLLFSSMTSDKMKILSGTSPNASGTSCWEIWEFFAMKKASSSK